MSKTLRERVVVVWVDILTQARGRKLPDSRPHLGVVEVAPGQDSSAFTRCAKAKPSRMGPRHAQRRSRSDSAFWSVYATVMPAVNFAWTRRQLAVLLTPFCLQLIRHCGTGGCVVEVKSGDLALG